MEELPVTFADPDGNLRINFGVIAGREATSAEIDELARMLRARLDDFAIVSEQRFQFSGDAEASVHQVRVELERPLDEELRGRVLELAEQWVHACAAARHADVLTPYPGSIDPVELPSS